MDNRTEQLADGVWRVELSFWVNAFLLANDGRSDAEGLTLVDTGMRWMGPRLVRSVRMLGMDPRAIGDVLLTHWHVDHAGSARRFAESSAAPRVWIGEEDAAVLAGDTPPAKAVDDARPLARLLHRRVFRAPPPVTGARTLGGGHAHEAAGGVVALAAPGHTLGHRVLHLPERGVLIAGDAVHTLAGLRGWPEALCASVTRQRETLRRLAALDFDVLAPLHGPPVERRARERLAALAGG